MISTELFILFISENYMSQCKDNTPDIQLKKKMLKITRVYECSWNMDFPLWNEYEQKHIETLVNALTQHVMFSSI